MTKEELNHALKKSFDAFAKEVKLVADDPYSKEPVTKGELFESHRQIFYALNNFKDILLEYLD